ncbi:MAG: GAF domain-containing protein [Desulfobacteraceae bacterium]|nr:GAF domain-containing protein [Desulfobacteraceae bacterium]
MDKKNESPEKKSLNSKSLQQKIKEMDKLAQTREKQIRLFEKDNPTLSAIFNNTEVGFLIVGIDMKIKWNNRIVKEWMEKEGLYDINNMGYKNLLGRFGKTFPDPGPIEYVFNSSRVTNFQFRMGSGINQTNIFMTAMPIQTPEGNVREVLVMLRDRTDLETLRNSQKELKQSEKLTKTLFRISNAVNTTFNLDDLFKSIHKALANIIDVTNLAIGIYDSNKDIISYPYYVDETNDVYHEIKDISSSGIFAAEVINLKHSLLLSKNDVITKKRKMGRKPMGSVPEQWLGVPLTINKEVIGVIVVQSYSNPELYNKKDADILMAISNQVATAITKKQSEDAQKKSEEINKVLFAISNAVNTTSDLYELYKSIHKSLGKIIDLTNFIIGLHNKKDDTILFAYYIDQFDDSQGQSMGIREGSVGGEVIRSGKSVFLTKDALTKKNKKIKAVGTWAKTWMGVPLKANNEVIGYMATQSYTDPDLYSKKDLAIFSSVSDQVALAIARKRAQDAELENKAINKALFSISNAVNTTDNLKDLYKSIHKSLEHIIDVTNFFIATYDRKKDILSFPYDVDTVDAAGHEIYSASESSSLTSEVILKGKPLFFTKQEMTERAVKMNLKVTGTPAELWLGVPLKTKEDIIGAIVIQSYNDPNIYDKKDMDLLIAVSDQVALAIERKRAEDAQKKSEKLNKVLFAISNAVNTTENLDELYKSIYDSLNQLKTLPNFYICIVDDEEKQMFFPLYIDEYDSYDPTIPDKYDENNRSITIDIVKSKKALFLNQQDLTQRHKANKLSGTKSLVWLGVPLIIRGKVTGVIAVQHYSDPNYFTHEDVGLFTAVSDQIALAIDRKRSQEIILEHRENLEKKVKDRTRELTKAKVVAEAAAKSKGEFLANMSHEIRTPINGIMGMAEIALGNELDDNLQSIIKTIDTEANSLLGIVNQILDFSKIEAGKLALEKIPFNLRNTFEQACSSLAININDEQVEFVCFFAPDIPVELIGDPGRLRQILINLTSNAIKFTHAGEIFVKGEIVNSDKSSVELRFLIKDTGIGIAIDKQKEIFEGFSQADGSTTREYGGTGLGTTISKQLAELMGGQIGLESELGKGSTFWFTVKLEKQKKRKEKKKRKRLERGKDFSCR